MRVLPIAAACLILSACGGSAGSENTSRTKVGKDDASKVILRLSDLPKGFRIGDDSGCGPFGIEGASNQLASFVMKARPSGCERELNRTWARRTGVPSLVESASIVLDDAGAAGDALGLRGDLLDFTFGLDRVDESKSGASLGDEGVAFETANALVDGRIGQPGAGRVWRSGNVLNVVFEGGLAGAEGRHVALELAQKQQKRVEELTPVSEADTDDREVSLDQPGLDVPVYWLGRTFDPSGDLPELELLRADSLTPGGGPGNQVKIDYRGGVTLDLWTPKAWDAFVETRLGRFVWSWPCTRSDEVKLARGRGVVYAGYANRQSKPCSRREPDRYLAHAFFDGVVVAVNMPYCYMCAARGQAGRDPYNSEEGMRAVLEGLRLRPSSASG